MIVPDIDPDELAEMTEDQLVDRIVATVGYDTEAARTVASVMLGTYDGPAII